MTEGTERFLQYMDYKVICRWNRLTPKSYMEWLTIRTNLFGDF